MKRIEIKWFKTCSTLDEVKRLYKTLSMLHHPDLGGNLRDMQEINVEFDEIKKNPHRLNEKDNARSWSDPFDNARKKTTRSWDDFAEDLDLKPGSYTVRITGVKEREDKKYVALVFDIDSGKHTGHFKFDPWYKHCIYLSYKNEYALKKTRETVRKFNLSNPGFDGDYAFCNDMAYRFMGKIIGVTLDWASWNNGDYLAVKEVYAV